MGVSSAVLVPTTTNRFVPLSKVGTEVFRHISSVLPESILGMLVTFAFWEFFQTKRLHLEQINGLVRHELSHY
jgi:putative effector of murein hydrolase LrgA (UPF0299 family)